MAPPSVWLLVTVCQAAFAARRRNIDHADTALGIELEHNGFKFTAEQGLERKREIVAFVQEQASNTSDAAWAKIVKKATKKLDKLRKEDSFVVPSDPPLLLKSLTFAFFTLGETPYVLLRFKDSEEDDQALEAPGGTVDLKEVRETKNLDKAMVIAAHRELQEELGVFGKHTGAGPCVTPPQWVAELLESSSAHDLVRQAEDGPMRSLVRTRRALPWPYKIATGLGALMQAELQPFAVFLGEARTAELANCNATTSESPGMYYLYVAADSMKPQKPTPVFAVALQHLPSLAAWLDAGALEWLPGGGMADMIQSAWQSLRRG